MGTEIYYISGSDNSLHAARVLAERISGTTLVPVVRMSGQEMVTPGAETVGPVFPIHGLTLFLPVRRFLEKFEFHPAKRLFATATGRPRRTGRSP